MWSEETKQGLLAPPPGMMLVDAFSSSEALGMGASVSSATARPRPPSSRLGPEVRVIDPDGTRHRPGSGSVGVLALGGRNPLGYYKDEAKSAATFRVIDGVRYSVPGDYARSASDGSIQLLGRGSVCINTGGEKVFPEEVEEVLKTVPGVRRRGGGGRPDNRFGEVVAVVQLAPGRPRAVAPTTSSSTSRPTWPATRRPRRVRFVETIGRAPSGKVDYARHRAETAVRGRRTGGSPRRAGRAVGRVISPCWRRCP